MMQILTNVVSKEQQKGALTETQKCSILNSILWFLQQYRKNIGHLCFMWLYDAYTYYDK